MWDDDLRKLHNSWKDIQIEHMETRFARLEQMAGETLRTAGYLAHYYDPD